eukprot:7380265-Prymnesium_polylepis.1
MLLPEPSVVIVAPHSVPPVRQDGSPAGDQRRHGCWQRAVVPRLVQHRGYRCCSVAQRLANWHRHRLQIHVHKLVPR